MRQYVVKLETIKPDQTTPQGSMAPVLAYRIFSTYNPYSTHVKYLLRLRRNLVKSVDTTRSENLYNLM